MRVAYPKRYQACIEITGSPLQPFERALKSKPGSNSSKTFYFTFPIKVHIKTSFYHFVEFLVGRFILGKNYLKIIKDIKSSENGEISTSVMYEVGRYLDVFFI